MGCPTFEEDEEDKLKAGKRLTIKILVTLTILLVI